MNRTRHIISIVLTAISLPLSAILSVCYFALWNVSDYLSSLKDALGDPEAELIMLYTGVGIAVTGLLSLLSYYCTLDAERKIRPRALLYLCFLGVCLQTTSLVSAGLENAFTPVITIPVALILAFGTPLLVFPLESLLKGIFSGCGRAAYKIKWYRLAVFCFHKALIFGPHERSLREILGQALFHAGNVNASRRVLISLIQTGGVSEKSLRLLAGGYEKEMNWELALSYYKKLMELNPEEKTLVDKLIELYREMQQPEKAIPLLEIRTDFDSLSEVLRLEDLYACAGNLSRVRQLLAIAARIEKPPCQQTLLEYRRLLKILPLDKDFLQELGDLCWELNKKEEAVTYYENILDMEPDNRLLRRKILEYYFESSQLQLIEKHIEFLIKQGELSPLILQEYAELLIRKEDYETALEHLKKARELYPDHYEFPHILSQLYYDRKKYDLAREEMAQSLRLVPQENKDQLQILYRKIEGAILNIQIRQLRKKIKKDPDNIDLRFTLIDKLMANAYLERVTSEMDNLLYYHPELKERMMAHIEDLANRHERNYLLLDHLADMYLRDENYDKCMEIYDKMYTQSLDPGEVAKRCSRKILRMNPKFIPALKKLGDMARDEKDWNLMIEYYLKCDEQNPDAIADRLEDIFDGFHTLRNLEKAEEFGRRLLSRDPENVRYNKKMTRLYLDMARFEDAVLFAEKAKNLDPNDKEARGLFENAIRNLKNQQMEDLYKQLEVEPDNSAYREQLGDLLCFFEKYTDAVKHYQRAAQLSPEADLCKAKLAFCLAKRGMTDLADETLAEIKLSLSQSSEQEELKNYIYITALQFERDLQPERAVKYYKQIFRVDASYRDIVSKIEKVENIGVVVSPYGKKIRPKPATEI